MNCCWFGKVFVVCWCCLMSLFILSRWCFMLYDIVVDFCLIWVLVLVFWCWLDCWLMSLWWSIMMTCSYCVRSWWFCELSGWSCCSCSVVLVILIVSILSCGWWLSMVGCFFLLSYGFFCFCFVMVIWLDYFFGFVDMVHWELLLVRCFLKLLVMLMIFVLLIWCIVLICDMVVRCSNGILVLIFLFVLVLDCGWFMDWVVRIVICLVMW